MDKEFIRETLKPFKDGLQSALDLKSFNKGIVREVYGNTLHVEVYYPYGKMFEWIGKNKIGDRLVIYYPIGKIKYWILKTFTQRPVVDMEYLNDLK